VPGTRKMGGQIRVGLVGAGWFATRRHLPDLKAHSDVHLAAICRRDEAKLNHIADHFGVSGRYQAFERMLSSEDLDAVVIATPHSLHYAQAELALQKSLHVLLEKPMTLRASEADALVTLATRKGCVVSVALNPPHWRHTHHARSIIRDGTIGDLEAISQHWVGNSESVFGLSPLPEKMPGLVKPSLYRGDHSLSGGGHLMDTGSHLISELIWLTGMTAETVFAQMDDTKLDMRSVVQVSFEGGVPANIICIGNSTFDHRRIKNVYYGSKGTLTIEGMPFSVVLDLPGEQILTVSEAEMADLPGPVADFIQAIQGGHESASTGRHGARVVRIMEAAYRSAECGKRIEIGSL